MSQQTHEDVQKYYGDVLRTNDDLKSSACCVSEGLPGHIVKLLGNVHEAVQAKFYGCGSPIPSALEGCKVLDLGCGSGRDVYILSQLVGETGFVYGIDMTDEQLSVANQHLGWHMDRFGYSQPNIKFIKGYIEDLKKTGIEDNSIDVVISNCVINLSPNKERVFKEILRVLKPGGELFFSDVFSGRRVPEHLKNDKVLYGECLAGAIYTEDFRRLMTEMGIPDTRVLSKRQLVLEDPELINKAGMIDFYSMTVRAFKVELEDICENYGHVAYYNGTLKEHPHSFILDDHHEFPTGLPIPVCGNTANMIGKSRVADHFRIIGDFSTHYGPFECGPGASTSEQGQTGACC
jgi:ubiquinone/menaquinone biosynthesis C-methylase UbiE